MTVPAAAASILRTGLATSPPMSWARLGHAIGCCDVTAKRWARMLGLGGFTPTSRRVVQSEVWARDDVHARLEQGWRDPDETAADIARAISALIGFEIGSNAVIGRAHRAVLGAKAARKRVRSGHIKGPQQPPPSEPALAKRREVALAEVAARRVAPVLPRPAPPKVEVRLRGSCKYPLGQRPFRFCGDPAIFGKAYCPLHCAICYVPPRNGRLGMADAA